MKIKKIKQKKSKAKREMEELAYELGFDDVKFLSSPKESDKNVAVLLFKRYMPSEGNAEDGRVALSQYYTCSNDAYNAAQDFARVLNYDLHIPAELDNDIQLKRLATRGGGRVGLNTIYYHDELGSHVNIRCVMINADVPLDDDIVSSTDCERCGACIKACPTNAISEDGWVRKKCIRDMMSEGIPIRARKKIYQLLGCEKCQLCCPMNEDKKTEPQTFDLVSVLKGEQTRHLKEIAGKNMATRTRLITQAICYAVAKGEKGCLPEIIRLTEDQSERISKIAVWGQKELEKA